MPVPVPDVPVLARLLGCALEVASAANKCMARGLDNMPRRNSTGLNNTELVERAVGNLFCLTEELILSGLIREDECRRWIKVKKESTPEKDPADTWRPPTPGECNFQSPPVKEEEPFLRHTIYRVLVSAVFASSSPRANRYWVYWSGGRADFLAILEEYKNKDSSFSISGKPELLNHSMPHNPAIKKILKNNFERLVFVHRTNGIGSDVYLYNRPQDKVDKYEFD